MDDRHKQYNLENTDVPLDPANMADYGPEGAQPILQRTGELRAAKRLVERLLLKNFTYDSIKGLKLRGLSTTLVAPATVGSTYAVITDSNGQISFSAVQSPLTQGTSGQVLTSNGVGNIPTWENLTVTNGNSVRQSQVVVSATNYYITNSNLTLPSGRSIAVGTKYVWRLCIDKTAAGTGTFQLSIYRGTNGSTSDTQDVLQTLGTQTAIADKMVVDISLVITTAGATGAYYWSIAPVHEQNSGGGFGTIIGPTSFFDGTVSSVDLTTPGLKFGLGFNSTTGTPTISIPIINGQVFNLV